MDYHSVEYIKSKFRCPICGQLAGCTKDGKVGLLSVRQFQRHIAKCRRGNRVKLGEQGTREETHE